MQGRRTNSFQTPTKATSRSNSIISNNSVTAISSTNTGLLSTPSSSNSVSHPSTPQSQSKRKAAAHQNNQNFYPRVILSQIISIQCFHYLFFGFVIQLNHLLYGTSITLDRIFTSNFLNVWTWSGWVDNFAVLLTFLFQAVLLAVIVEKSRKCLDFTVTLFFIHLVLCSIYSRGIPDTWDWWIVHVLGMILMVLLGEFLCSRKELMDIPLLSF